MNQTSPIKGPLRELNDSGLEGQAYLQKALEMSADAWGNCIHCKEKPTYERRHIIRLLERALFGASKQHRLMACADCAGVGDAWVILEADGQPKSLIIYKRQRPYLVDAWVYPPGQLRDGVDKR